VVKEVLFGRAFLQVGQVVAERHVRVGHGVGLFFGGALNQIGARQQVHWNEHTPVILNGGNI
jgi:hypothetical protein